MATYIVLCSFTDQGIRNVKDTVTRAEGVRRMAKDFNVTVKDIYWTLGAYDLTTVFEAPDDESVTALCLAIGGMGNIRTQMLRAFSADEMKGVLARVTKTRQAVPA